MADLPDSNGDGSEIESVKQTARDDFETIKDHAREDLEAVKDQAKADFESVRHEAGTYIDGQKNYAAHQLSGIAEAIGRVGKEMHTGENAWASRYADDIAHRLEEVADRARSSSLDDLVGEVEGFSRHRPAAFLATSALLGFATSRFLAASASRRRPSHGARSSGNKSGKSSMAPDALGDQ